MVAQCVSDVGVVLDLLRIVQYVLRKVKKKLNNLLTRYIELFL
jgi:hypothetical protein